MPYYVPTRHFNMGSMTAACGHGFTTDTDPYVVNCGRCQRTRAFKEALAKAEASDEALPTQPTDDPKDQLKGGPVTAPVTDVEFHTIGRYVAHRLAIITQTLTAMSVADDHDAFRQTDVLVALLAEREVLWLVEEIRNETDTYTEMMDRLTTELIMAGRDLRQRSTPSAVQYVGALAEMLHRFSGPVLLYVPALQEAGL